MDLIEVEGGAPLSGHVRVSGAKNAALPIMACTLLTAGETRLRNVPRVSDVVTFSQVLRALGAEIHADVDDLVINTAHIDQYEAPPGLVKTMRASFLVLGPLLARIGQARVSLPGGDAIGARPVNLHLEGLRTLGARLQLEQGSVSAQADRLCGSTVTFPISTVTGTEHLMMAATLAIGTTLLENAACEPEVVALAEALNRMGARITGAGTSCIAIEGVSELTPAVHEIIPDRIEAGTFLVAGAMTGGDVTVDRCTPDHLLSFLHCLCAAGAQVDVGEDWVRVRGVERARPIEVATAPYPAFPTDMQAQMMALLAQADGRSLIVETVFENRLMHVAELCRMGAEISIDGGQATVVGVPRLHGAPVVATDLRAGASLILAGLAAKGITTVARVFHLDRGYERIETKFAALGGKIRRVA